MSPLTSSVLALAALLAVATAVTEPDPYCVKLDLGEKTNATLDIEFKGQRPGWLYIPDKCSRSWHSLVGETIVVCYYDPGSHPDIYPILGAPNPYRKVNIVCLDHPEGCQHLNVKVTQYCRMVVPPIETVDG